MTSSPASAPLGGSGVRSGRAHQPRWLPQDQRLLFVAVGGFNTVLGALIFLVLQLTLGSLVHYLVVLLVSHVVTVLMAFCLHRRFVFQVGGTGSVLLDLLRFESVYLSGLGLNIVALPLLVEVGGLPVISAQLLFGAAMAAVSWFGHKHWSFRRPKNRP
jgi:putative flippase GtrA